MHYLQHGRDIIIYPFFALYLNFEHVFECSCTSLLLNSQLFFVILIASSTLKERRDITILWTWERTSGESHIHRWDYRVTCYLPVCLVIAFVLFMYHPFDVVEISPPCHSFIDLNWFWAFLVLIIFFVFRVMKGKETWPLGIGLN